MRRAVVVVRNKMQTDYRYELSEPEGQNFDPEFRPEVTPPELLRLGVFGGKYMTDCTDEFPLEWFFGAKLSPDRRDPALNLFGVDASQPLSAWRAKGWLHRDDPPGWFQWYCRYYRGAAWPTIRARSSDGGRCGGTSVKSNATARRETSFVVDANGKRYCMGL